MSDRHGASVLAVVQARASSRRLPGKVLLEIEGRPILAMVLDRLARCRSLDGIVLATSNDRSDDPIAALAGRLGQRLYRGPLDDVLGRFAGAIGETDAGAVVRITADCPLVEPTLVDRLVERWRAGDADYVANVVEPRSFPKGLDVEVISREALLMADKEATEAADREHVTAWVRARPEQFGVEGLWMTPPMPDSRVTLDTAQDLEDLRLLVAELGPDPSLDELISALGGPTETVISERRPR